MQTAHGVKEDTPTISVSTKGAALFEEPRDGGHTNLRIRFVFPIPASLPPAIAAPMLCAGLTVYSPLTAAKVKSGTRVGVVGIGGLGHFAVMFAGALAAEVTAISHSAEKKNDALKMGASHFLVTAEQGWPAGHVRSLDLIICTTFAKSMPIAEYLSLLDIGGTMVYVGIPEQALPALPPTLMIGSNTALRGSNTGSKKEALEMLELAASMGVKSWIEEMPMSKCIEAIKMMERGECRYRIVLRAGE